MNILVNKWLISWDYNNIFSSKVLFLELELDLIESSINKKKIKVK